MYSATIGHLDYFQIVTIMNKVTEPNHVQVFCGPKFSALSKYQDVIAPHPHSIWHSQCSVLLTFLIDM